MFFEEALRFCEEDKKADIIKAIIPATGKNPKILKFIFVPFSQDQRLDAVKITDKYGNTVLYNATNSKSRQLILDLFPEDLRLDVIKRSIGQQGTILHLLNSAPVSLRLVLNSLPEKQRFEAVMLVSDGSTVLSLAARYPGSLEAILYSLPRGQRLDAVREAMLGNVRRPKDLQTILSLLPENLRYNAVTVANEKGKIVLHEANNLESLTTILETLPENQKLEALKISDGFGDTILHRAIRSPRLLLAILNMLPENQRLNAIITENGQGQTVLRESFPYFYFKAIVDSLPKNQRLNALMTKNEQDQTLLCKTIYSQSAILDSLSPTQDEWFDAVKAVDNDGRTMLHYAALWTPRNTEPLKIKLALLSSEQRLAVMKLRDTRGFTAIHYASDKSLLETMLASLSPQQRIDALMVADEKGQTGLHKAASHLESLEAILAPLSPAERFRIVTIPDNNGETALHYSLYSQSFKSILNLLTPEQRYAAVKIADKAGITALAHAKSNAVRYKAVLDSEPIITMEVLNGFITFLGASTVAVAFTLLSGVAAAAVASIAITLSAIGVFQVLKSNGPMTADDAENNLQQSNAIV